MSLESEVVQTITEDAPVVAEVSQVVEATAEVAAVVIPEVVDIVDKLAKFPIGDWEEARVEILKLRDKLAAYEASSHGAPSETEPTREIETVTYPDGTQATGVAPLPSESPVAPSPEHETHIAELQSKLDDYHGQIATLTAMHEEATSSVAELQNKCVDLETQLALAKNAVVTPEDSNHDIEKHPAVVSLRSQVNTLRSDVMEKAMELAKVSSEISALKVAKQSAEAEVESTNNANNSLQARLDQAEKYLADEKAKVIELEKKLEESAKTVVEAVSPVFTLKNIFFKK